MLNSRANRKIVSNAAGYNDVPSGQQFEDMAPGSTFYDFIFRLVSRSIMSGYPCGGPSDHTGTPFLLHFGPRANATGDQTSN